MLVIDNVEDDNMEIQSHRQQEWAIGPHHPGGRGLVANKWPRSLTTGSRNREGRGFCFFQENPFFWLSKIL